MKQLAIKLTSRSVTTRPVSTKFSFHLNFVIRFITTLSVSFFLSACASYHGSAQITSSPPGAQVINVDTGEVLGVTPLLLDWKERVGTRQQVLIKLNKDGYYQKTEGFWLDMNSRSAKKASEMPNLVEIPMRRIGE